MALMGRMGFSHLRLNMVKRRLRDVPRMSVLALGQLQHSYSTDSPLNGVRVLDLTRVLAGPYCTMILGDLGADVIKIERPGLGDDTRRWVPPWVMNESAYFLSVNRNKKSVAIDMKSEAGKDILKQLALKSDVLVENYIPGKLEEYGLGYDQLKEKAPHLIYCSISGYGQTGPMRQKPGYDVIAAGGGGLMHITGPEEGEPCRVGVAVTDLSTGLYAHGAIMAALLQRYRTGQGQHIDCNLLSTQVATLTHIASNYLNAGVEARRYGNGHGSIVPYQAFRSADSYIILGCGNNAHFKELCQKMDLEELVEDPRYISNNKRVLNRDSLIKTLSDRLAEKTSDEWFQMFEGSSFPNGPINNMEQVFSDQQVIHNRLVQEMDHPEVGKIRVPGPAVRYSQAAVVLQRPPPMLGQHTTDVLKDLLNMDDQTIQQLRDTEAIA